MTAGHTEGCWTKKITEWRPRQTNKNLGRPQTRWIDDIRARSGKQWIRVAYYRIQWERMKDAYARGWIETGWRRYFMNRENLKSFCKLSSDPESTKFWYR